MLLSHYLVSTEIITGDSGEELATSEGDIRDADLILGLGISPREGNGNPLILAWRIPRTVEPGRLQYRELQRVRHD